MATTDSARAFPRIAFSACFHALGWSLGLTFPMRPCSPLLPLETRAFTRLLLSLFFVAASLDFERECAAGRRLPARLLALVLRAGAFGVVLLLLLFLRLLLLLVFPLPLLLLLGALALLRFVNRPREGERVVVLDLAPCQISLLKEARVVSLVTSES